MRESLSIDHKCLSIYNIYIFMLSASNEMEINELWHISVQRSFKVDVPKHLIIDSCNLQLNEPVGQGMYH